MLWHAMLPQIANASAPYRSQNPQKSSKEGFGVKKLQFPTTSEKGTLSKNPIFLVEPCREMGIFELEVPLSEVVGNWSFF